MNRKQKRGLLKANLDEIKKKQASVARVQVKAFLNLGKYLKETGLGEDFSKEMMDLLMDKKHEDEELQRLFTAYKEAKHAGVYLSMMKKELLTNGMPDAPEPQKDNFKVDVQQKV